MKDQPLKIAFIGSGGIATTHARAAQAHPGKYEIVAACDVHVPRAQELVAGFGEGIPAFESMEALYEAVGDDLDGVVVGTPHFLHFPAARFFLERGIPALIEKPVVCSLQEWDQARALETDTAFIQAAQMQRFDPEAIWLKDFVQSAERFGEPMTFDLNIWQNIEGYIMGNKEHWILDGKKAGGGIVASVGVHALDLLRFVTGQDFTQVTAHGRFDAPLHNGAESTCSALFKMSSGVTGTLHASYKPSRVPYSQRLVLYGERGGIYQQVEEPGQYAGPFRYCSEDPNITQFADMYDAFQPVAPEVTGLESGADAWVQPYTLQLLHFREAVLAGRKSKQNTLDINHNTIAVLDGIAESLRSGKTAILQQL